MTALKTEIATHAANLCIGCSLAFLDLNTAIGMAAPAITQLAKIGIDLRGKCQFTACQTAIEDALEAENFLGASEDALKEAILILSGQDAVAQINLNALTELAKQENIETQFAAQIYDKLNTTDRMAEAQTIARRALEAGVTACFANQDFRTRLATEVTLETLPYIVRIADYVIQLEAQQRETNTRLADLQAKADRTEQDGMTINLLQEQITALKDRLADPEAAYADLQATITKLEETLKREGNEMGDALLGQGYEALKAARETGELTAADEIFAQIEEREKLAVERAARAAYARGEIAEQEIRWADAALHYERASDLYGSMQNLNQALIFAYRSGDYTSAETFGRKLIPAAERDVGLNSPEHATCLNNLAELYYTQGKHADAEPLYLQAIEIGKATLGEAHPEYAKWLNNLAGLYSAQGKYADAEALYLQAIETTKAALGEAHQSYAIRLNNLALLYNNQGKYAEAEPLYLQAIKITKAALGETHPSYAIRLNNLAGLYKTQRKYAEAEPLYLQAIEIDKVTLGETHPEYAKRLNNLALLYRAQGEFEVAEPLYLQAIEITRASLGEAHPNYSTSLNNLALLYNAQGKYAEAEPLYLQAIKITKAALGEAHPEYALRLNNLAMLYKAEGKYTEAEPLYLQAIGIFEAALGNDHPNTETVKANYENFLKTRDTAD